jgi:hypothetical protein
MVIVSRVVQVNKLPCLSLEYNKELVCDACQQGKNHQLPFAKSFSVPQGPLELIHLDVWGPAPVLVGRKNYYGSCVNDFSKYTWVYLIQHKSEVFQVFHSFQNLIE